MALRIESPRWELCGRAESAADPDTIARTADPDAIIVAADPDTIVIAGSRPVVEMRTVFNERLIDHQARGLFGLSGGCHPEHRLPLYSVRD